MSVPAPVIELVATAQADAQALTLHDATEQSVHWSRARAAITAMATVEPSSLPISVRVAAQNAALRIAFDATEAPELTRAARAEVARLALPAEQLQRLGSEPQGLDAWLGPATTWRTRVRGELVSLHAAIGPHAHYRMIDGLHRALVHQMVAIDDSGVPQLTPIVGELELRESDADDAPACVAKLDVTKLGCGESGALVTIDAAVHPMTHFFHAKPDGSVGCNDCHTSSTFPLVDAARGQQVETEERAATLARVAARLASGGP